MDFLDWQHIMKTSESMADFADGDETFVYGEWQAWQKACYLSQKRIDPSVFKKKYEEEKQSENFHRF